MRMPMAGRTQIPFIKQLIAHLQMNPEFVRVCPTTDGAILTANCSSTLRIIYDGKGIVSVLESIPSDAFNGQQYPCLIGIVSVQGKPFLLASKESKKVAYIGISPVYEIIAVEWIPLTGREECMGTTSTERDAISELFLSGGHYYSSQYNLTLPYHLNKIQKQNHSQTEYYSQFEWNHQLRRTKECSLLQWTVPIIQGAFCFAQSSTQIHKIRLIVISRRSRLKTGTRFYARGLAEDGSVANFVETQQIVTFGSYVSSFLILRGSVPLFFEQIGIDGLTSKLSLQRPLALTKQFFRKHFAILSQSYSRIFCVNLLSEAKKDEQLLTENFEVLIESEQFPFLKYRFYDFHVECGSDFSRSNALIEDLQGITSSFSGTVYDLHKKQLISIQNGIYRVNCLDCLDRTNYVSSRLALAALKKIFKIINLPARPFALAFDRNEEPYIKFNEVWADNGDSLSISYTGVGSTHSDITRTGARTLMGTVTHKARSLLRFYMQFTDKSKHEATQNLLMSPKNDRQPKETDQMCSCIVSSCEIKADTYSPNFLRPLLEQRPQLLVLFLFLAVKEASWLDMLSKPFSFKNSQALTLWQENIQRQLAQQGYVLISKINVSRSWLAVFGREEVIQDISGVERINKSQTVDLLVSKMTFKESRFCFTGVFCDTFQQFKQEVCKKQINSRNGQNHYEVIAGNIASSSKISPEQRDFAQREIANFEKRRLNRNCAALISSVLEEDQFQKANANGEILKYIEGPIYFLVGYNRILLWSREGSVMRVKQYFERKESGYNCVVSSIVYDLMD